VFYLYINNLDSVYQCFKFCLFSFEEAKASNIGVVKVRGNTTVKLAVDVVQKASSEHGLRPEDIDSLVDAVISNKFRE